MRHVGLEDYVTVIAVREGKVLLLKEYSYPHDEWLWQFPEGGVEDNEDPQQAAHRELQEEASLASDAIEQLGMNYDHHRRTSRKNYIFTAEQLHEVADVTGDEEEHGIESHWFDIMEINEMVAGGQIRQKNMLAAWALFLSKIGTKEG